MQRTTARGIETGRNSSETRRATTNSVTNYGSLVEQGISSSIVKSSWPSSYQRAVTFQAHRDRLSEFEDEMLNNNSDTETEIQPSLVSFGGNQDEIDDIVVDEDEFLIPKQAVYIPKSTFWQSLFNSVNILMLILLR